MMLMASFPPARSEAGLIYNQGPLPIQGKGMYIWELWISNGGGKNLNKVISKLDSLGVTWIVIKMGDGDSYYNSPNHLLYNWAVPYYGSMDSVISVFHANGIKVYAFQYVYGVPHYWGNSASETDVANEILSVKGMDGLIIDAEIQYDTLANRVAAAQAYCDSIHAYHPNCFLGLTSWARVNGHNTFPWQTFLDRVNVNMPQTYWAARPTTPQNELSLMSSQFTYYTQYWDSAANKPIMPIGQGEYFGYGNDVKQGDVANFCNLCQTTYKYPGVSLWEYNQITHAYVWSEYAAAWPATAISKLPDGPTDFTLFQNYPNPFNPTTVIRFEVPNSGLVTLRVYDVLGREVRTLVNKVEQPGGYSAAFDASKLPSGVYFYRLDAGSYTAVKKLVVLK